MNKKVYIFGAGASIAANIPIQNQILNRIFTMNQPVGEKDDISFLDDEVDDVGFDLFTQYEEFNKSRKILADFIINNFANMKIKNDYNILFKSFFIKRDLEERYEESLFEDAEYDSQWDTIFNMIKDINISLEDLFTLLDKATILKEYFRFFSNNELYKVQKRLKDCIIYTLTSSMISNSPLYEKIGNYFVQIRLANKLEEDPFSLISLNWDTLLDYYLYNACSQAEEEIQLDYCYYNNDINDEIPSINIKASGNYNIKLMKLHGSMNWLMCNNCGRMITDYKNNISLSSLTDKEDNIRCPYCDSLGRKYRLKSSIITPTFLKDINNIHFKNIWHNAYLDLCEAKEIIFIGYSFPDADFELRYILKKAVKNDAKITVVLHESDDFEYYKDYIKEMDEGSQLLNKLSLPCNRYNSFFQNHEIEYNYRGIENYFNTI